MLIMLAVLVPCESQYTSSYHTTCRSCEQFKTFYWDFGKVFYVCWE